MHSEKMGVDGEMSDEIPHEPVLKKREIERDPEGRFERHGKTISKTAKKTKPLKSIINKFVEMNKEREINKQAEIKPDNGLTIGTGKRGPGRPKGSQSKTTLALKEQILQALDMVGGQKYLATLAIENSSAFAGLLGKVLPSTLAVSDSNTGKQAGISFERIIVWPDGHREIEGKTPKQLPAPQVGEDENPSDVA